MVSEGSSSSSNSSTNNSNTGPATSNKHCEKKFTACVIGDSISAHMDQKVIANVLKKEVRMAKAYSTLDDASETEAKERTRFPDKNYDAVIKAELKKKPTDLLIIQSGSVDITNLKTTGDNSKCFSEYFKQQAVISATNLFSAVSEAIL